MLHPKAFSRRRLLGGAFALAAVIALPAEAHRFRPRRIPPPDPEGPSAPPLAGDASITLQPADSRYVGDDVFALLGSDPTGRYVVTNLSTNISFFLGVRGESIGAGQVAICCGWEITDPFAYLVSSGAALGAVEALKFERVSDGATQTLGVTISEDPELRYPLGGRARPGTGGFPIHTLPGALADKRIVAQSTPNAIGVWTDEPALAQVTANGVPIDPSGAAAMAWACWAATSADKYASENVADRVVGANPITGPSAYWMDMEDVALSRTWRIYFDVDPTIHNSRPAPGRDTTGSCQYKTVIRTLATSTAYTFRAGDTILSESGAYITIGEIFMRDAFEGEGGVLPPVQPYTHGWKPLPDRARRFSPGWRTLRSRKPLGAYTTGGQVTFSSRDTTGPGDRRHHYLRICGFSRKENINFGNGFSSNWGWIIVDHCSGGRISLTAGDSCEALFFLDNLWSNTLNCYGRDCQVFGNTFNGLAGNDALAYMIYNTPGYGERTSYVSFNLFKNQSTLSGHGDFMQTRPFSAAPNLSTYYADGEEIPGPVIIGNVLYMGVCVPQDDGLIHIAQGLFLSEDAPTHPNIYLMAGNLYVGIAPNGIGLKKPGAASRIRNNTVCRYLLSAPTDGGNVPKIVNFDSVFGGPYPDFDCQANAAAVIGGDPGVGAYLTPDYPNFVGDVTTVVVNPNIEQTDLSLQQIIDNYSPKAVLGGLSLDESGNPRPRIIGCFGDLDLIDHRAQTWSDALLELPA
jgi:hypothetical protein